MGMILLAAACKDDKEEEPVVSNEVKFTNIALTGAKEVPANPSTASGVFNGTYNKDTNLLTYTFSYTGMTATNMHFHKGDPTISGGVVIPIASPYASPMSGTTRVLTDAEEVDLLAGLWYVNIHSSTYGGGEIRGQLTQ